MLSTSFKMPSAETLVSGTDFSWPFSVNDIVQHPENNIKPINLPTKSCPQSWLNSAALSNKNRSLRILALDVDIELLDEFSKKAKCKQMNLNFIA